MTAHCLFAPPTDELADTSRDTRRLPCLAEVADRLPMIMENEICEHDIARGCSHRPCGLAAGHHLRQLAFKYDLPGLAVLRIFSAKRYGVVLHIFPSE